MSFRNTLCFIAAAGLLVGCASEPPQGNVSADSVRSQTTVRMQGAGGVHGELTRVPLIDPVVGLSDVEGVGVAYTSAASLDELVKFYRGQMPLRGWNEVAIESDRRSYATLRFDRAGDSLSVTLKLDPSAPSRVRVSLLPQDPLRVGHGPTM